MANDDSDDRRRDRNTIAALKAQEAKAAQSNKGASSQQRLTTSKAVVKGASPTTAPKPAGQVMGKISAAPSVSKASDLTPAEQAASTATAMAARERIAKAKADAEYATRAEADRAQRARVSKAADDMQEAVLTDPASLVERAKVANIDPNAAGTNIAAGTGQVGAAPQVSTPKTMAASSVTASKSGDKVQGAIEDVSTIQGRIKENAIARAQTTDPNELAQLELEAAQLTGAQRVSPAAARAIETGELISGSAVDMAEVNSALQVEAAQADPSVSATVRGQMGQLMAEFDGTQPPAWAAGALRNATAQMAARGLGASSMAGQALVQAAMESALPIAMQDASTFAKFESQNLSNRQQTAMFGAEQRANFLGMKFTQEFQTRVANASKISDIANMNFTAETQIALENAQMAQTVDLANLSAKNAKMMSDAAAMSQMDMANLNNRQQSAVINAQSFLAMDMKNMDLRQQTELFKSQAQIDSIFSDQAADNAAKQFNAASENQTNQFFANMQLDAEKFNAGVKVDRDQFNSRNALVVAQANAKWRQDTNTYNTSAQNEANRQTAAATNGLTASMVDSVMQRERDIMDMAFRQAESAQDRALSIFLADKQGQFAEDSDNRNAPGWADFAGYAAGLIIG